MDNYNKLIKEMKKDLFFTVISCIVITLTGATFIIKDLLLIIFWCTLVVVLLSQCIIRFVKFKHNVALPMKEILNKELEKKVIEYAGCIFTENYIINKKAYWIIPYEDILLMSKQLSTEGGPNGGWFCTRLYMVTKKDYYSFILYSSIRSDNNHKLSEDVYQYIKTKKNDILIGNTKENKILLEKQYNIKLPRNWKSRAQNNE